MYLPRRFAQQDTENKMVENELNLMEDDASVYKLVGPVLLKQELSDVKHNVSKRLEFFAESLSKFNHISRCPKRESCRFIAGEIEKVDRQLESKQQEQKTLGEQIVSRQQDMRAKAAEEARKVFDEQTSG